MMEPFKHFYKTDSFLFLTFVASFVERLSHE